MNHAVVITVTFRGGTVGTYAFDKDRVVIGREESADIFLDNPAVSRQHACLELTESAVRIRDLASVNGTAVNGESVSICEVHDRDVVEIGKFQLHLLVPSSPRSALGGAKNLTPSPEATLEAGP